MNSKHFYLLFVFFFTSYSYSQVGIGTLTPAENALLEVASDSQGILIPRMTKAQRDAITVNSASEGLLIYQTDDAEGFYFYNGSTWSAINPASMVGHWSPSGDDIYNNNAQYVGIGTGTAITAPLHVKSGGSTSTETETVPLHQNDFSGTTVNSVNNSGGCGSAAWSIVAGEAKSVSGSCGGGPNGNFDQTLIEGPFIVGETSIDISFDYGFNHVNSGDGFTVTLYNNDTGSTTAIIPTLSISTTATYTGSFSVTAGESYSVHFRYVGKKNAAAYASVDNVFVTEETVTVVSAPAIAFRLEDGTQGEGNVLTSDAEGNAYWMNVLGEPGPIGGDTDWIMDGDEMYNGNSGDIGIGTTFPTTKLYIEENIADSAVLYVENTNASSSESYGIYGATYATNATGAAGVFGESDYSGDHEMGVKGKISGIGAAIAGIGDGMTASDIAATFNYGIWGGVDSPKGVGVYAWSVDLDLGPEDYAYGLYVVGDFAESNSTKSGSVPTTKGNQLVYSVESPEIWFKDYGSASLINGEIHIAIDELFQETIFVDAEHPMHVRVQEQGDCNGLFVIPDEDGKGFTVKEKQEGTSNISFSYKITAKRRFYQDHRFGVDPNQPFENNLIKTEYREPASMDPEVVRQKINTWTAEKIARSQSKNEGE